MKNIAFLIVNVVVSAAVLYALGGADGKIPAVGSLLDPVAGLYYNARTAMHSTDASWMVDALEGDVQILRDERGVPHIFAEHDLDAVTAMGFALAQDRLFQLDFIPRVASGTLSEIFGPGMIETDRFLRQTGMEWGAQKNLERILEQQGIELELLRAYCKGVNAYVSNLAPKDYPFEFKLLGYKPSLYTELHMIRVLQYMTFDLTYRSDDADYGALVSAMDASTYEQLYPQFSQLFVPIIPESGGKIQDQDRRPVFADAIPEHALDVMQGRKDFQALLAGSPLEGFIEGKGSNNWAVGPERSATGAPILAGDMHLSLWLPSIWYEVHLVTPSMNTYGVTYSRCTASCRGVQRSRRLGIHKYRERSNRSHGIDPSMRPAIRICTMACINR